eukprot:7633424-Lingulodinium_polyedra.AAC.1
MEIDQLISETVAALTIVHSRGEWEGGMASRPLVLSACQLTPAFIDAWQESYESLMRRSQTREHLRQVALEAPDPLLE